MILATAGHIDGKSGPVRAFIGARLYRVGAYAISSA
jgi:hypothetical protein